jgi:hypothetical protein
MMRSEPWLDKSDELAVGDGHSDRQSAAAQATVREGWRTLHSEYMLTRAGANVIVLWR